MTPHYSEKFTEEWKTKLAHQILQIEAAAPGKFAAYKFIQKYSHYPPEAIYETFKLLAKNIQSIKKPWPYAEKTLTEWKGPKAHIKRAEAVQERIKRETGLAPAGDSMKAFFRKLAGVDEGEGGKK